MVCSTWLILAIFVKINIPFPNKKHENNENIRLCPADCFGREQPL